MSFLGKDNWLENDNLKPAEKYIVHILKIYFKVINFHSFASIYDFAVNTHFHILIPLIMVSNIYIGLNI